MLMEFYFLCTTPTPISKVSYNSDCTDTCIFRSSKVWLLRCIVAVTDGFMSSFQSGYQSGSLRSSQTKQNL